MGIVGATIRQDVHVGSPMPKDRPTEKSDDFDILFDKFIDGEFTIPRVLEEMYQTEVNKAGEPNFENSPEPNPTTHPTLYLLSQIFQLYKEDCLMRDSRFMVIEIPEKSSLIADIKGSLKDTDFFIGMCVALKTLFSHNTINRERGNRASNINTAFEKLKEIHPEIVAKAIPKPTLTPTPA